MAFRCMRRGWLHTFLAKALYKKVLTARNITHSLRVRIYETIIRPMERDLIMRKRKALRKIYGPRNKNDYWGKVKCRCKGKVISLQARCGPEGG